MPRYPKLCRLSVFADGQKKQKNETETSCMRSKFELRIKTRPKRRFYASKSCNYLSTFYLTFYDAIGIFADASRHIWTAFHIFEDRMHISIRPLPSSYPPWTWTEVMKLELKGEQMSELLESKFFSWAEITDSLRAIKSATRRQSAEEWSVNPRMRTRDGEI